MNMKTIKGLIDMDSMLGAVGLCRKAEASGFGSFLFGMGMGLVAGGAAALLLAPSAGSETREKLVRVGGELGSKVQERVAELSKQIRGGEQQLSSGSESTGYAGSTSSYGSNTRIGV